MENTVENYFRKENKRSVPQVFDYQNDDGSQKLDYGQTEMQPNITVLLYIARRVVDSVLKRGGTLIRLSFPRC